MPDKARTCNRPLPRTLQPCGRPAGWTMGRLSYRCASCVVHSMQALRFYFALTGGGGMRPKRIRLSE